MTSKNGILIYNFLSTSKSFPNFTLSLTLASLWGKELVAYKAQLA